MRVPGQGGFIMSQLAILGGEKTRQAPFPPWPQFSDVDRQRLLEVLESRNWGGFPFPNRYASEFAAKFAARHGAAYGCALANGTVSLVVALKAAGIRFGDEVIVPAYTWDGTATAVLDAGAAPVFADADPNTYCLDVECVRRAMTPRTRAVIPVHLAMRFADMDALLDLARENDLAVIEDCAHVHGGAYNGRGAGSMGDIGSFSLQTSKLMTSGEGGMLITSRPDYFELIQTLVNCGRASETDRFRQRMTGSNHRLSEFQAALLLGQLERLDELAERRGRNARRLTAGLAGIPGIRPLPPQPALTREAIYCYVFQYRPDGPAPSRDLFAAALEAEGVPCDGRFYEPVYRSDLFHARPEHWPQLTLGRDAPVDYAQVVCPVAERAAYSEAVWLPQFVLLGEESDAGQVVEAVAKVVRNLEALSQADPALAGVKGMSRAERPRIEKKNY
jgi:dTDP-4-amino-4,6-dideoxygalactose transaminase